MLQIKNTLGGGKSNAPYAWAKYEVIPDEILTNPSIDLSYVQSSDRINITGASFDLSFLPSVTNSNGLSLNGTDNEKQVVDFFTGFQIATNQYKLYLSNDVLTFYFEAGALSITEFHNDTDGIWFTVDVYGAHTSFEKTLPFTGEKIARRSYHNFIEYITDKSPTKYPNGEVHIDGYFYRYALEGLYVWKKYEISSELKELNESASTLPYDFTSGCAVVYNNEIHILGSTNYRTKHYKWNGNAWELVSTLPYDFTSGSAVVYNNEIHILGSSYTVYSYYQYHYKWDGSAWTKVSTLPYKFYSGSAVVYNNEIHILGSVYDSSTYTKHYKFDGSSWTEVSTLPYSFYDGCAVVYNGEIHILGSNAGSPIYKYHYKWNGSIWENVSTIPYPFRSGSAVVFDGNIYIFGGTGTSYSTNCYKWDGSSWSSGNTLPIGINDGDAVVLDNMIYILYLTNHYKLFGYIPTYTFLDYIVSDKETAYPDGGEKGGYWYEKIFEITPQMFGCTKMAIDYKIWASASVSISYDHSLGEVPKVAILTCGGNAPLTGSGVLTDICLGSYWVHNRLVDGKISAGSNNSDASLNKTSVSHSHINGKTFAGVKYTIITMA